VAPRSIERRHLLRLGGGVGATLVGGGWLASCASDGGETSTAVTTGPPTPSNPNPTTWEGYGPLGDADANGIQLPEGFTSRVVATSGAAVAATGYVWPADPDGGAVFPTPDDGWIYVVNHETSSATPPTPSPRWPDRPWACSGTRRRPSIPTRRPCI
jgi:hypothetical protein